MWGSRITAPRRLLVVDPVLTRPIVMMVRKDFDPALATLIRAALKRILATAPQVQRPS